MKVDTLESNKDVIKQYYIAGGEGVPLTDKQDELRQRWEYADEMIRTHMGRMSRGEIAVLCTRGGKYSIATAKSDMSCAEDVFCSSFPLNKKHRIQLRVEFMEKQSRLAAAANDFDAVAKIEKSIAFYLDKYPDTVTARPRRQVVYNIQQNFMTENTIPEEEADAIIEDEINRLEAEDAEPF